MANIPDNLPQQATDKYQIKDNTFIREVKPDPKDRIEVEVGDSKQPDFKPQFKFMRWDNEVNFSLRAQEHPQATVETVGEKIIYKTPDYEVHQYDKPEVAEDGGFEFEWFLSKKPTTNTLIATIETKGLNFFYQPALTQEEIDKGASRPENVEGSYAVYHKTKGGMNRSDGMEYKTGKAFHIYRPKITDANGDWTWGELNITGNILKVTVDQGFLDNAVYPIIVDPTFGYTSQGANALGLADASPGRTFMKGMVATLSESGTVTAIDGYFKMRSTNDSDVNLKVLVYDKDSNGADSHDLEFSSSQSVNLTTSFSQETFTVSQELTADTYILTAVPQPSSLAGTSFMDIAWDTTGGQALYDDGEVSGDTVYDTPDNPWSQAASATYTDDLLSIYATYTAGGGGGAAPDNTFLTTRTKFWGG